MHFSLSTLVLVAFAGFLSTGHRHNFFGGRFPFNGNREVAAKCSEALRPNGTVLTTYSSECRQQLQNVTLFPIWRYRQQFQICIADKYGFANDAKTGINSTRLREVLTAQVTGSDVQTFAEAGIANCPDVRGLSVKRFIKCVKRYCNNNGTLPSFG